MGLTNKQVDYILKNRVKHSAKKISKDLNVDLDLVEKLIQEHPIKPIPKLFYLVLASIPVIALILLELILQLTNYGNDYDVFISPSKQFPNKLVLNPEFPKKYFGNSNFIPSVIPDFFDKEKKKNAFRIFVLGGSSAAGWPYPNNVTFSRYLQRRFELEYPENEIEVINLGMSAVNSYTILDMLNSVIENKPDLVLVYAGHNEYYGALGAGSHISLGSNPALVNLLIKLKKFKTYQLLSNIISFAYKLTQTDDAIKPSETLMGKMVGESSIPLNSDVYNIGVEQMEYNFDKIFSMLKNANIPVIVGNLSCNYKIKPFVSNNKVDSLSADYYYSQGIIAENNGDVVMAKELLKKAKDLDQLRFRAPSVFNDKLFLLARKYNFYTLNIDSVLSVNAANKIVGFDLMVDHLHPNKKGYTIIGKEFHNSIAKLNLAPKQLNSKYSTSQIDSLMEVNFPFTKLDSVWSSLRISKLMGAYPFVPKGEPNTLLQKFKIKTFIDSVAVKLFERRISHLKAHELVAQHYLNKHQLELYIKEMEATIADRRFNELAYFSLVNTLINLKEFNRAYPFLLKLNKLNSNDYTNKYLGSILVEKKEYGNAIPYLLKSIKMNDKDPQVYFNLAGAYYFTNNKKKAIKSVKKAIELKPDYQAAKNFYNSLTRSMQ